MNPSLLRLTCHTPRRHLAFGGKRAALGVLWVAACLLTTGCQPNNASDDSTTPPPPQGRSFASPQEAVQALTSAARAGDRAKLLDIMGPEGEQIVSSGDDVADRQKRDKFLALFDERHTLVPDGEDSRILVVGNSDWPFPVPIVRGESSSSAPAWYFDSAAGLDEILNRRIGENELSAIQVCKAIADAQRDYAMRDPDGDSLREYARKFISDDDKRDGLYWPTKASEEPSPLGAFAAAASAEGYTRRAEGPTPYHGYFYRILEAQGPHAPNGSLNYVVDDQMLLGFAVVAYPAEYGDSGIMTFIMGPDEVVYQRDLGEETAELATSMTTFDPGPGWLKQE